MKFSIFLPTGFAREFKGLSDPRAAYEKVVRIAQVADASGYDALLVPDHLTTMPPSRDILFEAWSLITGLAGETSRVRLGQMVTATGYRNPALSARIASTVDVISGGRLQFGLGAGWYEPDYSQCGYEFGTAADRLASLEEAAQIILSLWTRDETTFEGKQHRAFGALMEPKGLQQPHIPLLIAGSGEKVTLRIVAQYADACNVIDSPDVARHKFAVLQRHAERLGRDYDRIKRTVTALVVIADSDSEARDQIPANLAPIYPGDVASYGLIGSIDTVRQRIAAYEQAGVDEVVAHFGDPTSAERVAEFAELFVNR